MRFFLKEIYEYIEARMDVINKLESASDTLDVIA